MNKALPRLDSVNIENFKAIRRSGTLKLAPFTAIIGSNGSGKSSLVEALEFLHEMTVLDLPSAIERWRGFEHIWNKFGGPVTTHRHKASPMKFHLNGHLSARQGIARFSSKVSVGIKEPTSSSEGTRVGFLEQLNKLNLANGMPFLTPALDPKLLPEDLRPQWSTVLVLNEYISGWQFLMLEPDGMGAPQQTAPQSPRRLSRSGRNIAQYLYNFQVRYPKEFADFVDAIRFVVPYMQDMRAEQSLDIVRTTFLSIVERSEMIPGWLVSSGTLRVCAIMACLMHPAPPTLLVIEEIENGLDPRTLGLVTSTIQSVVEAGRTQVIATTHSPTFLDNVPAEYIMTVTRDTESGEPKFKRVEPETLGHWLEDFSPGKLYTMGVLTR